MPLNSPGGEDGKTGTRGTGRWWGEGGDGLRDVRETDTARCVLMVLNVHTAKKPKPLSAPILWRNQILLQPPILIQKPLKSLQQSAARSMQLLHPQAQKSRGGYRSLQASVSNVSARR